MPRAVPRFRFVAESSNRKTGPIPVITAPRATCPTSCPLRGAGGCYAESYPLKGRWDELDNPATKGLKDWHGVCASVAALPAGTLYRYAQAGDLPGEGDTIDATALSALVRANSGKRGYTYTHKPMHRAKNRVAVADANAAGFTINLSADSPSQADSLAALAIAPVVLTVPRDYPSTGRTPAGRKIVVCPAQEKDGVTCKTCGLCAVRRPSRAIVAFRAHGQSRARLSAALAAAE